MKKDFFRITDANFNRAREGMRVVEDVLRFFYRDEEKYVKMRSYRHLLSRSMMKYYAGMVGERNSGEDPGAVIKEKGRRKNLEQVMKFNLFRVEEALRVLEEVLKMRGERTARKIKGLRYKIYEFEKEILSL